MASVYLPCLTLHHSANRVLSIHSRRQYSENMSHRRPSSSTTPKFTFDESFLKAQTETMAGVPSMFFTVLTANVPGLMDSDEGLCVSFNMPGVTKRGLHSRVTKHNTLLVEGVTHEAIYVANMKLPENFEYKNRDLSVELTDGMLKLTLPILKSTNYMSANIMDNFVDTSLKIHHPKFCCAMIDRSYLDRDLSEIIAHVRVKCKSFTVYKKESLESIYINGCMPGLETIEITKEGTCVSLSMPGLEIEDVESGFEKDTFLIEGKRKNECYIQHYVESIIMPEDFHAKDNMIKRVMKDGMYKATLPHVDAIKEEV